MNDMTVEDALDYLDNVCVCHGCECWQDHDWGGCYRTQTTGKMACDLRDEAVDVLRKVVFRAMGAKDINVPNKGFWKPVYASEATGFDPSLAGCDPVFNHVCSVCGQETWTNDLGEEYLSDFCPHCGADIRQEYVDIPMEYFESGEDERFD